MRPRTFAIAFGVALVSSCAVKSSSVPRGFVSFVQRPADSRIRSDRTIAVKVWSARADPETGALCEAIRKKLQQAQAFARVLEGCDEPARDVADLVLDVQITEVSRVSGKDRFWWGMAAGEPRIDTLVTLQDVAARTTVMQAVVGTRSRETGIAGDTTDDMVVFTADFTLRALLGYEGS